MPNLARSRSARAEGPRFVVGMWNALLQLRRFHGAYVRCTAAVRTGHYSGADFIYSPTREAFVLYSPGPDKKDDASRPYLPNTEAGDLVLWPLRSER